MSNFLIYHDENKFIQRDDDGIDQHVQLDVYSASSQTQQMHTSYRLIKPRPVEILMFYGTEGEHINHDGSLSLSLSLYIYIYI
jgi:hypothetical protein